MHRPTDLFYRQTLLLTIGSRVTSSSEEERLAYGLVTDAVTVRLLIPRTPRSEQVLKLGTTFDSTGTLVKANRLRVDAELYRILRVNTLYPRLYDVFAEWEKNQ